MYATNAPKPEPPRDTPSVGGAIAAPFVIMGLLAVFAYPLTALAVAGVAVGARLLQRGLQAAVARSMDRVREFPLPGVGTVRFRIAPR